MRKRYGIETGLPRIHGEQTAHSRALPGFCFRFLFRFFFSSAHLDRFHLLLLEGARVEKGEIWKRRLHHSSPGWMPIHALYDGTREEDDRIRTGRVKQKWKKEGNKMAENEERRFGVGERQTRIPKSRLNMRVESVLSPLAFFLLLLLASRYFFSCFFNRAVSQFWWSTSAFVYIFRCAAVSPRIIGSFPRRKKTKARTTKKLAWSWWLIYTASTKRTS